MRQGARDARGESVEIVLVGNGLQTSEDVAQVGGGVLAVAQVGDDERINDGGAATGVGVADKRKRPAGLSITHK